MAIKRGVIYQELDYRKFKKLSGNRTVSALRIRKIKDSIESVGYILNPICVNEKMEIIDGQGRFEVLKEFNMPIDYYVAQGAGVEECISMNINMSNWRLDDYIDCYADMGITSYKYLRCLYSEFHKLGMMPILNACGSHYYGKVITQNFGSRKSELIKQGYFECNAEEYSNARELLNYINNFFDTINTIKGGRKDLYYLAISFAYKNEFVDKDVLLKKVTESRDLLPALNIFQALDELSRVYNFRNRAPKIYLKNDYERLLDKK